MNDKPQRKMILEPGQTQTVRITPEDAMQWQAMMELAYPRLVARLRVDLGLDAEGSDDADDRDGGVSGSGSSAVEGAGRSGELDDETH